MLLKIGCAVCGGRVAERCEVCDRWFCEDDAVMTPDGARCKEHA